MGTTNSILKFIEKMNKTCDYDYLFALLLFKIDSEYWLEYFMKQMSFIKSNSFVVVNYKHSCYHNGKMQINYSEASLDGGVIPHEFGHFIFDKMIDKKEDSIIVNLFKEETNHFIEDERYLTKLHQKYCPSITWHEISNTKRCCPTMITDGISILKGKRIGINHNSEYPIEHLASELFAEVLEAEVLGYKIPLAIYKGECPQTYLYIRNKIYEILNPSKT